MQKQYTIMELERMPKKDLIEIIKNNQYDARDFEKALKDIKLICNIKSVRQHNDLQQKRRNR